ncbi:MAG: neutral/alkaline non-lysosomal ceramidase N-terminal domain-containing protein [Actinomycetota bacterium]
MSLNAGFGRGVITPSMPVSLAGFGQRKLPAAKVHDELEARALYLDDGNCPLCLIVCDLLAMSAEFADPVRDAVGEALGLPRESVLVSCIHTHSGPSTLAGSEVLGWPVQESYARVVLDGCVSAAIQARQAAERAEVHFARSPLPQRFSVNRRRLPYEPTFAVLDVRRPNGTRIGVLANVSVHPVTLGARWMEVSSDWVGPFRDTLEHIAGGCAIQMIGTAGDVNPSNDYFRAKDTDPYERTASLGREMAVVVAESLDCAQPAGETLASVSRTIRVPIPPAKRERDFKNMNGQLLLAGAILRQLIARASGGRLFGGSRPLMADLMHLDDHVDIELVEWNLGSVRLVSVPGEAFHAFGRAVEQAFDGRVLMAGLAPVWQGYLPHPFRAAYEESMSLGRDVVEAVLQAITGPAKERTSAGRPS